MPFVVRVEEKRYWRQTVSHTFHGRDIFAPVAGHLSLGVEARLLGPVVTEWVRLARSEPTLETHRIRGEVVFVDHFGNLITNIDFEGIAGRCVRVGAVEVRQWVRTYGEAEAGALVALGSSEGRLGDFARRQRVPRATGWASGSELR